MDWSSAGIQTGSLTECVVGCVEGCVADGQRPVGFSADEVVPLLSLSLDAEVQAVEASLGGRQEACQPCVLASLVLERPSQPADAGKAWVVRRNRWRRRLGRSRRRHVRSAKRAAAGSWSPAVHVLDDGLASRAKFVSAREGGVRPAVVVADRAVVLLGFSHLRGYRRWGCPGTQGTPALNFYAPASSCVIVMTYENGRRRRRSLPSDTDDGQHKSSFLVVIKMTQTDASG